MADVGSTAAMLVPSQAINNNNSTASNDQSKRRNNQRRNNKKKSENAPPADSGDMVTTSSSGQQPNERNSKNNGNNRRRRNRGKQSDDKNQAESAQPKGPPDTQGVKQQPANQGKKKNNRKKANRKRYPWRRFVPDGSVDPITLDPLVSLTYPPFALCADAPYDVVLEWPVLEPKEEEKKEKEESEEDRQTKLLQEQWGSIPIGATTENADPPSENHQRPLSERNFNLFDGRALAYYMVSQLQFIDPLNRRDLTRDELVNLNHYLKRHGFHDLNVVDAYDTRGITISTAGAAASSDAGRAQLRQQQVQHLAQTLLDSIFSGNSVTSTQPAAMNPLQQQYAATQRQEQQRRRQNRNRNRDEPVDRGIYGSEEAGLVVIDDDANPGLRGGGVPPSSAGLTAGATSFTPGTLWSANHITNRYQSHAESNQATNFPPLAAGAPPAAAPASRTPQAVDPVKKGPSRSLARITKIGAKADPKELKKQREARELFVKRAAMSNMAFGSDPTQSSAQSGLLTPGLLGPAATSKEASEGQLLRNQAFASALGVVPSTMRQSQQQFNQGWARPTGRSMQLDEFGNELSATAYPDSLIVKARENMGLALKMEKRWAAFLADDSAASLPLNKMNRDLRVFVHEYSDHWKLHTESFDPEPNRYIHCVKLRDTSAPHPLLSEAARNWRGPRPVVVDLSDHAVKQTAGQTPREFGPPPEREPLHLKPRSADSTSPPPGFLSRIDTESEAQVNTRSDELFSGRARPRLDLAPRTRPVELPPVGKSYSLSEGRERQKALREEQLRLQRQVEEKKQRILESAFASESEEESLKSHDSADWDDVVDEAAIYSGSDEEQ